MVVSKEAFQEVGGFDQGFWNGNEDVDLCLKLARAGWRILYEPASRLIHHESSSGPERFTAVEENRRRLTSRWLGKLPEKTLPSWPGGELASSR